MIRDHRTPAYCPQAFTSQVTISYLNSLIRGDALNL